MRYYGSRSANGSGDTLLHRGAYKLVGRVVGDRWRSAIEPTASSPAHWSTRERTSTPMGRPTMPAAANRVRPCMQRQRAIELRSPSCCSTEVPHVNAVDSAGHTPLARALGNQAMTELLLSYGANTDNER